MTERLAVPPMSPSADRYEVTQACRERFLRHLAEALRGSGAVAPPAIETAGLAAGRFFDESIASRRAGFEQADGLTASKISLVCDDQLELEILLGEMVKRLGESSSATLWRLYLRFATLLRRPELAAADTPVGPQGICQGLGEMCAELGGGLAQWTPLLESIEKVLAEQLPVIYGELNDLLAGFGIEPAQAANQPSQRQAASTPAKPQPPAEQAGHDPLAALQNTLLNRHTDSGAGMVSGPTAAIPVELLNQLLARLDILERLDGNEVASVAAPGGDRTPEVRVANALQPGRLGIPTNRPEAAAIDALALIFEAIFAEPTLPDGIKSAIASLQIPILKTAILDPGFFAGSNHPARQLLDRMAGAALGLPRQAGPDEPVCNRLQEMAAHIRNGFDGSATLFEQSLVKVETLIAQRNGEVDRLAQSYLPLAKSLARHQTAARRVKEILAPRLAGAIPPAVAEFLDQTWSRHLQSLWLEPGEGSPAWQEALGLVDDLLWSIQPKVAPDDRRRLAHMVSGLLRRINGGLDEIGISQEERAPFLDACFALQTAAIRSAPAAPPPAGGPEPAVFSPPRSMTPEAARPQLESLAANGLTLKVLDLPGRIASAALLAAPPWKHGDWVEIRLPDGEAVCGRLSALATDTAWPLFANPAWSFGLLVSPVILDRQLRNGDATVRSTASFFDAAAAKALNLMASSHSP